MQFDKNRWLKNIKDLSEKFIENNYSEELSLFDTFWQVFAVKFNEVIESKDDIIELSSASISQVISEVSFAQGYSQDFITPVVTLTIAEVLHALSTKKISAAELESLIHSSSARHGAKPSLTACLIRSLPPLCSEIVACKNNDVTEAIIRESPRPSEYRIWTERKNIILNSIDNYEKKKVRYLFWIDIDNPPHELTPMSIRLLIYLIEKIGSSISIEDIIRNVFDDRTSENDREGDINKINQQLSKLEAFSKKRFRQYIMSGWPKESLGLNDDFEKKYFLFSRVVPGKD